MRLASTVVRRLRREEDHFRRVDMDLLQDLVERRRRDRQVAELRDRAGVVDDDVLDFLLEMGIDADSVSALSLYPVVQVAWADGRVVEEERQAVLEAATRMGCGPGTRGHELLADWLDREPSPLLESAWQQVQLAKSESAAVPA